LLEVSLRYYLIFWVNCHYILHPCFVVVVIVCLFFEALSKTLFWLSQCPLALSSQTTGSMVCHLIKPQIEHLYLTHTGGPAFSSFFSYTKTSWSYLDSYNYLDLNVHWQESTKESLGNSRDWFTWKIPSAFEDQQFIFLHPDSRVFHFFFFCRSDS
jgi:hypothetical protein